MRPLLVLLALVLVLPFSIAAAPRVETQTYGPDHFVGRFCGAGGPGGSLRENCFALDGTESRVALAVRDHTGLPQTFRVVFAASDGSWLTTWDAHCDAATLDVPAGAATLDVWPESREISGPCGAVGAPSTFGAITAYFT
jgi:hypothetical protein